MRYQYINESETNLNEARGGGVDQQMYGGGGRLQKLSRMRSASFRTGPGGGRQTLDPDRKVAGELWKQTGKMEETFRLQNIPSIYRYIALHIQCTDNYYIIVRFSKNFVNKRWIKKRTRLKVGRGMYIPRSSHYSKSYALVNVYRSELFFQQMIQYNSQRNKNQIHHDDR